MGYQTILDFIFSTIVGGLLFLVVLNFNARNIENKRNYSSENRAFSSISTTMQIINEDFNRIGYCADRFNMGTPVITSANANSITFKTDTIAAKSSPGNGVVDLISYRLGALNTATPYSKDRFLERRINNGAWQTISSDVTDFTLRYYRFNKNDYDDSLTTPVANLDIVTRVGLFVSVVNSNTSYTNSTGVYKADSVQTFKSSLSFELR
jgi:hypothetical protein